MSKPLVVTIPHQLGREAARQRLVAGVDTLKAKFADKIGSIDERWSGDHLDVDVKAMGQSASGSLDVADDHVRVEVSLPWMLAMIAEKAKSYIEKEGQLLLEKKR
ncbi:polyhydroxyalkanoic acid system family protein [Enterovirga sp.]|jgi:putative polyhydroxyalkanoate system protein|uniref:polyhydroxyalkanoic acid system family protein n=1 Tax=Enterovirga sp. TaxID=2026350 RepID=UPI00261B1E23|nr:polyhydroxyalkanoic acid system family protein [Enterovirga sp.]MDB5590016.1 polyhydroxyalkanoic acid synthase [Enterovirga sp.]